MSKQTFSIWLLPIDSDHNYLSKIIQSLSEEHDAPFFQPHCTLFSSFSDMYSAKKIIDQLDLDSFDVDWRYTYPSAAHHLKELTSIIRILNKNTLVVVDDSPAFGNLTQTDDSNPTWKILDSPAPSVGGKGFLVHEYAKHVGAKVFFSHYQTAWMGFNK